MNRDKVIIVPEEREIDAPLIFLAGPIQGAEGWQSQAIKIIQEAAPDLYIASPRQTRLPGEFVYEEQVDWETKYLRKAAESGAILFWLAREHEHHCERAYAQTSRFELGEWKTRHEHDGAKLVVGFEEGFPGARYMKHRLLQDCPNIPICSSLKETCHTAVSLCNKLSKKSSK